ncbi:hypothetical protein NC653_007579 [Populus alba x Populus x berolinensis]|uniref:Uncharacterized protein n=1 Tax=Populus alba x Populus x berolinensis TaxID=444605 RepID=A0AAD6WDN4_9ROSI|nr:hypothetical protein NC653_007579 [Populus alba x Populus x berolinensis]
MEGVVLGGLYLLHCLQRRPMLMRFIQVNQGGHMGCSWEGEQGS